MPWTRKYASASAIRAGRRASTAFLSSMMPLLCSAHLLIAARGGVLIWGEERRLAFRLDALLLLTPHLLDGLRERRQLLWGRATLLDDNIAHRSAHIMMRAIGRLFAADRWVIVQLLLGEGCAEEVGGQFVRVHPVENLLPAPQSLTGGDHGGCLARV